MAATFDFTTFFTQAFLGATPIFTAWLILVQISCLCNYKPQSQNLGLPFNLFSFSLLYTGIVEQDTERNYKYL